MSIILYTDGSHVRHKPKGKKTKEATNVVGWGIVAHHNDTTVEIQGSRNILHAQIGQHEYIAFIEAMLYAKSHGFKYEEMSFYSDEQPLSEIGTFLHPDNKARTSTINKIKRKLKYVCTQFYSDTLYKDLINCLCTSRIHWVKGHKDSIYNKRVDYLARTAANSRLQNKSLKVLSIEDHLLKHNSAFVRPEFIAQLLGVPNDSKTLITMPEELYVPISESPNSISMELSL